MTDWTPQDDWSQVKVGDPVKAERGETVLVGEMSECVMGSDKRPIRVGIEIRAMDDDSQAGGFMRIDPRLWQLSVPAKPAVVLPTEAGAYLDTKGEAWSLCRAGGWFSHGDGSLTVEYADEEVESVWCRYGPFTKLEPVAVTAKKVLDAIDSLWIPGNIRNFTPHHSRRIAAQFGVTDD